MNNLVQKIGLPRLIISTLFILVLIIAVVIDMPMGSLVSDTIQRFGMFGILVLAMVPSIQSGTGPNFALPIGVLCGLMGALIAVETNVTGLGCFFLSIVISIPIAVVVGYFYGRLLNMVKGSEMTIATYSGFAVVSFSCILWIMLPFKHPSMKMPLGKGLKQTILLDKTFGGLLDNLWRFEIGDVEIPTGLLLFFVLACVLVYLFTKSKSGTEILAGGKNPKFALASGVDIDKNRIKANILSTVLAAVGIIVYSQSFGFLQLYTAPEMMAFPAVAAILIGGATAKRAKVSHVLIGVLLFQGLLTVSLPVANKLVPEGNLSEIIRMVVQNGIILYALTKVNSKGGK